MTDQRPTMREYWNARAGDHWAEEYEQYDARLGAFGDAMLDAAELEAGQRVLDVGCGSGTTTLQCARRVGQTGSAVGIDLSAKQLAVARSRAADENVGNVEFVQDDVVEHPFAAGSFDRIVSRFGVMFFSDAPAAFARITDLLTSGGMLSFVCWQKLPANDWMFVPVTALAKHTGMPPTSSDPAAPGPFSLADDIRIRSVLASAGFDDVDVSSFRSDQPMGANVDEAIEFFTQSSVPSTMLANASPSARAEALASLRDALGRYVRDDGVFMKGSAWVVTARKP